MNKAPAAEQRFSALDGWRGWSSLVVVLFHLFAVDHFSDTSFLRNCYLFVDFFFVLSGFVITHAFGDRIDDLRSAAAFAVRRFGRMWPMHAFMLFMFLGLRLALAALGHGPVFNSEYSAGSFLTNLLMIQSLGVHNRLTWNGPSWSISVEFYTYLVFALLLLLAGRRRALPVFAVVSLFGLVVVAAVSKRYMGVTYDFGIFRGLYGFFAGACARILSRGWTRQGYAAATAVEGVLTITALVLICVGANFSFAAPPLFAALVVVLSLEGGAVSQVLGSPPLRRLGDWSYSIYLLHAFIVNLIVQAALWLEARGVPTFQPMLRDGVQVGKRLYLGSVWRTDILSLSYLLLVILLASQTYRYIEVPARLWFNRLAKERLGAPRRIMAAPEVPPL